MANCVQIKGRQQRLPSRFGSVRKEATAVRVCKKQIEETPS